MKELNFLQTSEFLIPSSTGEYTPTNITTVYEVDSDLEETNPELVDELDDNGIQLIYSIGIKEAPHAYHELLKQLTDTLNSDFIGDDDFFDYLPDLVNQMQHIAFCYNHNCPEDSLPIENIENLLREFDKRKGEQETLYDQCEFSEDHLINEQQLIQRILKEFPEDQQ